MSVRSVWNELDNCGAEIVADPTPEMVSPWEQRRCNQTTGNYETEEDARNDFVSHVNEEHWRVEEQVTGEVVLPKLGADKRRVCADVVLFPQKRLIEAGWLVGPVCVELKRSGVKLGPVISQAMDYMRCVFNGRYGLKFMPQFGVVFPLARVGETAQAIMSHNRIGHSHIGQDGCLRLYLNGVLAYTETGGVFLRAAQKSGRKFGSR